MKTRVNNLENSKPHDENLDEKQSLYLHTAQFTAESDAANDPEPRSFQTTLTTDLGLDTSSCTIDRILAIIGLALLTPLLIPRAMIAKLSTGKVFDMHLMPPSEGSFKLIRFGGFHAGRKLGLLFNVARGDLHLIGRELVLRQPLPANHATDESSFTHVKFGLLSITGLRRLTGTAYENDSEELPSNTGLQAKLGFILRYAVAKVLAARPAVYRPNYIDLLGIRVNNMSVDEALAALVSGIDNAKKNQFAFVNPDCLNQAVKDSEYCAALSAMSHIFADGIGLQIGSRILGSQFKANVNGTDLFPLLCQIADEQNLSIFLLGGRDEIAASTSQWCNTHYPNLRIAGTHHGYFDISETDNVIQYVNASKADILLVAFGVPYQELWLTRHVETLNPLVQIGVGGLFDFYSGRIARSPRWMQEIGMEWVWRLMQEPKRMWRRYVIGNPLFLIRILRQRLRRGKARLNPRFNHTGSLSKFGEFRYRMHRFGWRMFIGSAYVVKRLIDITASLSALIVLSPILLLVAIMIRVESPGSILFSQTRVGKWGSYFKMYKFRSMYVDAEARKEALLSSNEMNGGVIFKMKSDPRVTNMGRFIRKYSIDELPQLFNVLKGEMSLVGPRPPLPAEVDEYQLSDRRRLETKPGITCLWQVSGRSDIPFDQQVELDVEYIESQSLWKDITILLKTIPAVLLGRGAY